MAFVADNFQKSIAGLRAKTSLPGVHTYVSTTDTLKTIAVDAYFNTIASTLDGSDVIAITGSDRFGVFTVAAVSPDVELTTRIADPYVDVSLEDSFAAAMTRAVAGNKMLMLPGGITYAEPSIDITANRLSLLGAGASTVIDAPFSVTDANVGPQLRGISFLDTVTLTSTRRGLYDFCRFKDTVTLEGNGGGGFCHYNLMTKCIWSDPEVDAGGSLSNIALIIKDASNFNHFVACSITIQGNGNKGIFLDDTGAGGEPQANGFFGTSVEASGIAVGQNAVLIDCESNRNEWHNAWLEVSGGGTGTAEFRSGANSNFIRGLKDGDTTINDNGLSNVIEI